MKWLPVPWIGRVTGGLFLLLVTLTGRTQSPGIAPAIRPGIATSGDHPSIAVPPDRPAPTNFRQIFAADYEAATRFLQEHAWMADTLRGYGVNPEEALSVIFPELLRYNELEDDLEVGALRVLYIQWGPQYADFSIGRFQMKPSFALRLERDCWRTLPTVYTSRLRASLTTVSDSLTEDRRRRIARLTDLSWQLYYLALFFHYMDERYPPTRWNKREDKVRFYAAAYNSGYWLSERQIHQRMTGRFFATNRLSRGKYCYGDIAVFYFQHAAPHRG